MSGRPGIVERARGRDADRVTTFELLFDLVFVFAVTQVAGIVEHGQSGLRDAAILLPLVWFSWVRYAWLGNLGRADEGLLRFTMVGGMVTVFFMAVVLPRAFGDDARAAVVMAVAFGLAQLIGSGVLIAMTDINRPVILRSAVLIATTVGLLAAGAASPGTPRLVLWSLAVVEQLAAIVVLPTGRWQVRETGHFTERFGLVILIALGENLVETGTNAAGRDLTITLTGMLACALVLTIALWWLYFDAFLAVAERALASASAERRARLARDGYAYLHLLMVAGIVGAAAGMALLVDGERTTSARWLLDGGIAVYLVGHLLFRLRAFRSLNTPRAVVVAVLLVGGVALAGLGPFGQLCWPAALIAALVGYELIAYRAWRRDVRSPNTTTPVEPMTRRQ